MISLPVFNSPKPVLTVWGEPTVCYMGLCDSAFVKDGSTPGSVSVCFGGSAYATAIGTARRGVGVCFYGPFGSDDVGAGALRFAVDNGVKVSPIASKESRKTIVVVDTDKTRSMVSDSADAFSLPYADSVPDLSSDVVHVSLSSIAKDESNSVLALLERSSLGFLSIDLGSVGVINRVSGGVLDRITNSAERVLIFANSDESRAARDRFGSVLKDVWCLVERSGPTGCYLTSGGESVYEPSLKDVSVIDTTGAGDAFAAGFLAAWMTGETDPNSVLKAAHAASADVISRVGTV